MDTKFLKEQEIIDLLHSEITDEQAVDSNVEGDSDADDCPDARSFSTSRTSFGSVTSGSFEKSVLCEQNQNLLRDSSNTRGNETPVIDLGKRLRKPKLFPDFYDENTTPKARKASQSSARRSLILKDQADLPQQNLPLVDPGPGGASTSAAADGSSSPLPFLPDLDANDNAYFAVPKRRCRRPRVVSDDEDEDEDGNLLPVIDEIEGMDDVLHDLPLAQRLPHQGARAKKPARKKRKAQPPPVDGLPLFRDWKKTGQDPNFFEFQYQKPQHGPLFHPNLESPKDIFLEIIGHGLIELILDQSNLYAQQKNVQLGLTKNELLAFIGVLIVMGFHDVGSVKLYWSHDENVRVERIVRVMSVKRFLTITRNLHLNDNSMMKPRDHPEFDKLFKLRPMLDMLNARFSELYQPSRQISIDESMIAFKGRSSMKMYMPMKPVKRGFKVWNSADANTGYMLKFQVYTGCTEGKPELGLGEKVVLKLSEPYHNEGRSFFFDNMFTSIPLLKMLLDKGTFGCGTLRANRKFYAKTKLRKDSTMRPGDSDFIQAGDFTVTKWMDRGKRPVLLASNMHNGSAAKQIMRKNAEGNRVPILCPKSVCDYNAFMGGVDHFDQLMSFNMISHKSRRWWMKLFYWLLNACVVNSYVVYKLECSRQRQRSMTHREFRSKLANELIDDFCSRTKPAISPHQGAFKQFTSPPDQSPVDNTLRLFNVGEHYLNKGDKYRRCRVCSSNQQERRSKFFCARCDVPLCVECFSAFHGK